MHNYRLTKDTQPTLWNVAWPLFGLCFLAALIWAAPALWSWWGLLLAGIAVGCSLYLLGMAKRVAVLEEREG